MTNANERYEDRAEDRVEVIKARIRCLNELLKQLDLRHQRRRPNTNLPIPGGLGLPGLRCQENTDIGANQ